MVRDTLMTRFRQGQGGKDSGVQHNTAGENSGVRKARPSWSDWSKILCADAGKSKENAET